MAPNLREEIRAICYLSAAESAGVSCRREQVRFHSLRLPPFELSRALPRAIAPKDSSGGLNPRQCGTTRPGCLGRLGSCVSTAQASPVPDDRSSLAPLCCPPHSCSASPCSALPMMQSCVHSQPLPAPTQHRSTLRDAGVWPRYRRQHRCTGLSTLRPSTRRQLLSTRATVTPGSPQWAPESRGACPATCGAVL